MLALAAGAFELASVWRRTAFLPADPGSGASAVSDAGPVSAGVAMDPSTPSQLSTTYESLRQDVARAAAEMAQRLGEHADALAVLAAEQQWADEPAEAAKTWRKCLALDPRRKEACLALSRIAGRDGEAAEALQWARQAVSLDPASSEAARTLGHALINAGQFAEAADVLQRAARAEPRSSEAFCLLGDACSQMAEFDRAKEAYRRAVELTPDYTQAYYGLATVCSRLGQKEEALKHRERFSALKQRDRGQQQTYSPRSEAPPPMRRSAAHVFVSIGLVYARHGEASAAEAQWRKAAAWDAENVVCRDLLVDSYLRHGRNLPEALTLALRAAELEPTAPRFLALGVAREAVGDRAGALAAIARAVELAPNQPKFRQAYETLKNQP